MESQPIKPKTTYKPVSAKVNGAELTERQKKCGDIRGKHKVYSEKLRCWFYTKKPKSLEELESRYVGINQVTGEPIKGKKHEMDTENEPLIEISDDII
jgi:hypothetical protein